MDARLRQRNAEVVLNTLTTNPYPINDSLMGTRGGLIASNNEGHIQLNGYYETPPPLPPPLPSYECAAVNPQYESLDNVLIQSRQANCNNGEMPLVECPAYATLPTKPCV